MIRDRREGATRTKRPTGQCDSAKNLSEVKYCTCTVREGEKERPVMTNSR
jgi:hypothetical protein